MIEIFERLVALGIQILPLPEITTHFVFERDGFICLVERLDDGFGRVGSAGLLTPGGLAPLVWRGEQAFFVAKGFEQPAAADEVQSLRKFAADLESALDGVQSGPT